MKYLMKVKSLFKRNTIPMEDLFYLNELLQSNLPIKTCLDLINTTNNSVLINSLIEELNKGYMIENVIDKYLPKEIIGYIKGLLKNLSFKESLQLSLSFYLKNKENLKTLQKAITYPLVLLFISLTALYLFDCYGLDSIINLIKAFDSDTFSFSFIRTLIRIIIYIFYFSFLLFSILALYFLNQKRITIFYILLSEHFPNSIIKTYFTEDFISLFVITLNMGYRTKDALEILKSLNNKPLISFLAFHLDEKLLEGKTLKEASSQSYFDDTLEKFVNIASFSNNFTGILNNYAEMAKEKIKNRMKLLTGVLEISSYLIIGIVIIFIYQVLFLPMQLINSI